jgi:kynurenine formamidase
MRLVALSLSRASVVAIIVAHAEPTAAQSIDLSRYRLVDLTHAFGANTLYWPTSPGRFRLDRLAYGQTPGGYFYAAYAFSTPEHGGTHLDAPIHFAANGATADRVRLEQLVAPAVVIDVSAKAAADPVYRLTPDDVQAFERRNGRIARGTIVLLRTGWSTRWPNRLAYFGDATPGDASKLRFPSYGSDAADLLVRGRGVAALGVDVASIDYGPSTDFRVHRIAAAANVPGLENLTRLDELPPTGALIIALPMKIEGGSGGPLRAIALVPQTARR